MWIPRIVKPRRNRAWLSGGCIGIDWTNRLTRGLVGFYLCWEGGQVLINHANPGKYNGVLTGATASRNGPRGPEQYYSSQANLTNYYQLSSGPILGGNPDISVVAGVRTTHLGSAGPTIYAERGPISANIYAIDTFPSAGQLRSYYRNDASVLANTNTAGKSITDGYFHVVGSTKSTTGGYLRTFIDGKQDISVGWAGNDNFTDNPPSLIGNTFGNANPSGWIDGIQFVALFMRALSDAEHYWFAADPYQFLILPEDVVSMQMGGVLRRGTVLSGWRIAAEAKATDITGVGQRTIWWRPN